MISLDVVFLVVLLNFLLCKKLEIVDLLHCIWTPLYLNMGHFMYLFSLPSFQHVKEYIYLLYVFSTVSPVHPV